MSELTLRPAHLDDVDFLFTLLAAALGPHVAKTYGVWDEADQRTRFEASLRLETHEIVELDGRAIGCIALEWLPDRVKLNRVFVLPEFQGRGVGSQLVRSILADAQTAGLPVHLRVFKVNPAERLWRRLGFAVVGETETHWLMRWGGPMAREGAT